MAFGKKAAPTIQFDQSNVSMLAAKALAERRSLTVRLALRIIGETPLLMHRWSQKALMEMLGKMTGRPVPRMSKDLTNEFEASYFRNLRGEIALPCRILKASIVNGAITTGKVTSKAELKRDLRVLGYTCPLNVMDGKKPRLIRKNAEMKPDCRIASNNGTPDVRARAVVNEGYFFDVVLQFPTILTPDKVIAALEGAGSSIGLCDWRPENGGDFGCFRVECLPDTEIPRILNETSSPEEMYTIPDEFMRAANASERQSDSGRKARAVVEKVNGDARRAMEEEGSSPPAKRGPGRPRKVRAEEVEVEAAPPPAKRGPGRPRKVPVEGAGSIANGIMNGLSNGFGKAAPPRGRRSTSAY